MKYDKTPLIYTDQVDLWESRGLHIPNKKDAEFYFQNISYYRLSAYAITFQSQKDKFDKGTTFNDILNLYKFDKHLRSLTLDAVERIEVALRTQMIYVLSHKYGSHWQDAPTIFKVERYRNQRGVLITKDVFTDTQNIITEHCRTKYPEVFIKHYINKYTNPVNPPSWMVIELLTIGQLSRLFSGLKNPDDKRDIASFFSLHHTIFESWLHSITYGRNLCAHHSRFWDRDFVIQPDIPKKNLKLPWLVNVSNNRRCFYFLSVVRYLLQTINPKSQFKQKILTLMGKYPNIPFQHLGIPDDGKGNVIDWQQEPLWAK